MRSHFDADYADSTLIATDFFFRANGSHRSEANLRKSALNLRNLRQKSAMKDLGLLLHPNTPQQIHPHLQHQMRQVNEHPIFSQRAIGHTPPIHHPHGDLLVGRGHA